ncbi:MAG: hypothetical protein VW442_06015 [Acidimicrobiaceae bacterium]
MKLLRSLAALMVPFLIAGCYEISMDFNVNDDGSGTYEIALDVDLITVTMLVAEEGEEVDTVEICNDMLSDAGGSELAGSDAEVEVVNDGLVCRQIVTGSWEAGAAEIVEESGDDLSLTPVGDGWRFEFNMESLTSDLGDDEEMDPAVLALMGVEISYALAVTLPGAVAEHNGELSGNTVSWEINLLEPPEESVLYVQSSGSATSPEVESSEAETTEEGYVEGESSAPLESAAEVESSEVETSEEGSVEGESPADGSSSSTVVIVIIVLVVIAGVAVFLLRRKTNTAETPEVETPEVATAEVADSGAESSTE